MSGRTHWRPKDAAWWRRARIVEVGLEFGPAAAAIQDWLECEATAQRDSGWVKAGYVAIAHGSCFGHLDVVQVRPVVSALVRVGLLDDFEEHGPTFTCRISGWHQDVELPLEAARKAASRAARKAVIAHPEPDSDDGRSGTGRDVSGSVRERPPMSPTGHDITEEEQHVRRAPDVAAASIDSPEGADPEVLALSRLLASLIVERDPKAAPNPDSARWLRAMRLLVADRDGDVGEVERVLRWSQGHPFWQANVLSAEKLRSQFTQLLLQADRGPTAAAGKPENEWDRSLAAAMKAGGA